jgi:hypothetical protein
MKRTGFIYFFSVICFSINGFCQDGSVLKKNGIEKLSVFLGTWKAENKPGSSNLTTSITRCEWSLNGRYLICDQLIHEPDGQTNNLSIYSYDSLSNSYLLSLVGIPHTDPFSIPMSARGDTLIYSGSYVDKGKKIFTRTLNIFRSSSYYIFISQYSTNGDSWINTLEGSASKSSQ